MRQRLFHLKIISIDHLDLSKIPLNKRIIPGHLISIHVSDDKYSKWQNTARSRHARPIQTDSMLVQHLRYY